VHYLARRGGDLGLYPILAQQPANADARLDDTQGKNPAHAEPLGDRTKPAT
jgi:hypothetical protein